MRGAQRSTQERKLESLFLSYLDSDLRVVIIVLGCFEVVGNIRFIKFCTEKF
eukprot:c31846_g1_i1 orf=2-154(-)